MSKKRPDTHQKSLELNLHDEWYGTVVEIGAGQETARWLFHVGGAAGTVAKTMSAYDKNFSNAIYGQASRFVSRQRLMQMLNHEFDLLGQRLEENQKCDKCLFAFANTVSAYSHSHKGPGRGWIGIRFQMDPAAEPSQIVLHVQLLDRNNLHQQQALGVAGINLIYGAFMLRDEPGVLIDSFMDQLDRDRIEIDVIQLDGPYSQQVDNRWIGLELVDRGLTDAVLFRADGMCGELSEHIYKKPVLLQRGRFRPVTLPLQQMLERALDQLRDTGDGESNPVVISEMNRRQSEDEQLGVDDLIMRIQMLHQLGRDVVISNFREYYRLTELIARYTSAHVVLVLGAATLPKVLDPDYYDDLSGGLLEAMGRLFKQNLRFYVYPYRDEESRRLITPSQIEIDPPVSHLYEYLRETEAIVTIEPEDESELDVFPEDVLEMIDKGDDTWVSHVPGPVAETIKSYGLFGYTG